jgi:hypothetical protein
VATASIAWATRCGLPMPDSTAQLCAIESMRHSTLSAEPRAVPSSK